MYTDKLQSLEKIKNEVLSCKKCDLGCTLLLDGFDPHVMGQGNVNADLMFIAEAPGKQETIAKQPLTSSGTSGKVYENILSFLDLTRKDVYTTNVVLCRPPKNRDPEPYEIRRCKEYLVRQIKLIEPKLIITFGRFAAQYFINNLKITKDHGKIIYSDIWNLNIFPLYHPAYFKAYASAQKRIEFKEDVSKLKNIIKNGF